MPPLSMCVAIAGLAISVSPAIAAPNPEPPIENPSVRLAHPAMGCGSYDDLKRIADAAVEAASGREVTVRSGDCRTYRTIHGEIIEQRAGAACVLGLGNSVCIWFPESALEPARHL